MDFTYPSELLQNVSCKSSKECKLGEAEAEEYKQTRFNLILREIFYIRLIIGSVSHQLFMGWSTGNIEVDKMLLDWKTFLFCPERKKGIPMWLNLFLHKTVGKYIKLDESNERI